MKKMEEKILREGQVLPGDILKVGSFLNQNIDTEFLGEMAREFARLYKDAGVTKVLTIEASGIAIAAAVGMEMGVPVLFAKKHRTSNVDGSTYSAKVHSFTLWPMARRSTASWTSATRPARRWRAWPLPAKSALPVRATACAPRACASSRLP